MKIPYITFTFPIVLFLFASCQMDQKPTYVQDFRHQIDVLGDSAAYASQATWDSLDAEYQRFEKAVKDETRVLSEEFQGEVDSLRRQYRLAKDTYDARMQLLNAKTAQRINRIDEYLDKVGNDIEDKAQEDWKNISTDFNQLKTDVEQDMTSLNQEVQSDWKALEKRFDSVASLMMKPM